MSTPSKRELELEVENSELRAQLEEAQETLRAIQAGEVDALVLGEEVYTLKGAETPYRLLIESMNEGAATLAADGTVLYCNHRFAEMAATPVEQVIGALLCNRVASAQQPIVRALVASALHAGARAELTFSSPSGPGLPVLLSLRPIHQGSDTIGVVATDLTERKRAEEAVQRAHDTLEQRVAERTEELRQSEGRFRLAADAAHAMVYELDLRTLQVHTLHGLHELLGCELDEADLALEWWDRHIHPEDLGKCHAAFQRMQADGQGHAIQYRIRHQDGRTLWVEDNATPVRDETGKPVRIVGTVMDITERKEAEEALRQTGQELRRSNRDLEQFAYVASHDLKEPLRAVSGYARLLQRGLGDKLSAKHLEYIAGATEGATRMEQMIDDLLAYARVGTGEGARAPADLNELLIQAQRNLLVAFKNAGAELTTERLPTLVVDAAQITQLFQNLIANAIKFCRTGPPKVQVGARQEPGRWVVSVRDNGIGIPPEHFARLFQVFQRLHTRSQYPGTGIGLAICQRIVEGHGGAIWVESQPGKGSTFYFSIPEAASG